MKRCKDILRESITIVLFSTLLQSHPHIFCLTVADLLKSDGIWDTENAISIKNMSPAGNQHGCTV